MDIVVVVVGDWLVAGTVVQTLPVVPDDLPPCLVNAVLTLFIPLVSCIVTLTCHGYDLTLYLVVIYWYLFVVTYLCLTCCFYLRLPYIVIVLICYLPLFTFEHLTLG